MRQMCQTGSLFDGVGLWRDLIREGNNEKILGCNLQLKCLVNSNFLFFLKERELRFYIWVFSKHKNKSLLEDNFLNGLRIWVGAAFFLDHKSLYYELISSILRKCRAFIKQSKINWALNMQ